MKRDRVPSIVLTAMGLIPYAAVALGLYVGSSALLAMLAYHGGICIALIGLRSRFDVRRLVSGIRVGALALLVPLFALTGVFIYCLWPAARIEGISLHGTLLEMGLGPQRLIGFAVYYIVVNATLEELFWRGALMQDRARPVLRDLLFGGYHGLVMAFFVGPIWVAATVVLLTGTAWIWRMLARRFGGLAVPWLTHMAADAAIMAAVWLIRP